MPDEPSSLYAADADGCIHVTCMQAAGGAAGAPQPRVEQPNDGGAAACNLLPAWCVSCIFYKGIYYTEPPAHKNLTDAHSRSCRK
jgi:hypothetical protein